MFCATEANAALKISDKPTQNVTCTGGVCFANANNAILNITDLTNLLSVGNVTVQAGTGAKDIHVDAAVSWTSSAWLTLDAARSIVFTRQLSVAGPGVLTMMTDGGSNGGDIRFDGGAVKFADLAHSGLQIDGHFYTLFDSVRSIVHALRKGQSEGEYLALAKSVRSGKQYSTPPINTDFQGTFEGLGNRISGLKISGTPGTFGLFVEIDPPGVVRDLRLADATIFGNVAGGIAGSNDGAIINCTVSGQVSSNDNGGFIGGLVGGNSGLIENSSASVAVSAMGSGAMVGGLVGLSGYFEQNAYGKIEQSYATGSVTGGGSAKVGGLVGSNEGGEVSNSYATAAVTGGSSAEVGGLIGENSTFFAAPIVTTSYSTGAVSGGDSAVLGGVVGTDLAQTGTTNTYWDLDASGINNPSQGAGNVANDSGITGLTTEQFLAGLPANFKKSVWKQKPSINNGYPYLTDTPSPK
jgi:The GLUG motif